MIVFSCLDSVKTMSRIRTAVFSSLAAGLWRSCVATDVATNMLLQPTCLPACANLFGQMLSPVFTMDTPDNALFVQQFMVAFSDVLRKQIGPRAAYSVECTSLMLPARAYKISVLSYVAVTFQHAAAAVVRTEEKTLSLPTADGHGLGPAFPVRVFPFTFWRSVARKTSNNMEQLFLHAYEEIAGCGGILAGGSKDEFQPAHAPVFTGRSVAGSDIPSAVHLHMDLAVAAVSVQPTNSKEVERLSVRLQRSKQTQLRLENEISNLRNRAVAPVQPLPSPPAPVPIKSSRPAASRSPSTVSTLSAVSTLSSSSSMSEKSTAEKALKLMHRSVEVYMRHLSAPPKIKPADSRAPHSEIPSRADMLDLVKQRGSALVQNMQDLFTRLGSLAHSIEELETMDDYAGLSSLRIEPSGTATDADKKSLNFVNAFKVLLSTEGEDPADFAASHVVPGFLRAAVATRKHIHPVYDALRQGGDYLLVEDKFSAVQNIIRSAMTTAIALFVKDTDDEKIRDRAVQFHLTNTTTLASYCRAYAISMDFCISTAVEHVERGTLNLLHGAIKRIIGVKENPAICFAMFAVAEAIPTAIRLHTEAHSLLSWILETCEGGPALTPFPASGATPFPDVLRHLIDGTRKKKK
jgi:hypothetical protein